MDLTNRIRSEKKKLKKLFAFLLFSSDKKV